MIISCSNCNKKFNLDEKLIPKNGRLLQCSICNHKWHYKLDKIESIIDDKIILSQIDEQLTNDNDKNITKNHLSNERSININKKKIKIKTSKKNNHIKKKYSLLNILNTLIIIIITFVAIILILDTFNVYISNYFPSIFSLLNNLYETFFDIILFIRDLIN